MREVAAPEFTVRPSWNRYSHYFGLTSLCWAGAFYILHRPLTYPDILYHYFPHLLWNPQLPSALLLGVGALFILRALIRRYAVSYTLRQDRLIARYGLIIRDERSVRLADIRSIHLRQGVFDRLLGIGDLVFSSAASSDADVIFRHIRHPERVKMLIERRRDELDGRA